MRPLTACPRQRSSKLPGRCDPNVTGLRRCAGYISRKRTGSCARSACRPGQTSWSARWCACSLRRITSRSSLTGHTVSGKSEAAIPHCGKCRIPGPGPCGSSRGTSPTASGKSIMRSFSGYWRRKSSTTGFSG